MFNKIFGIFNKIIDNSYKEMCYKYSKKRIEEIEAIELEIKRCEKGIEKTDGAKTFTSSNILGEEYVYKVQSDIMKRAIKVGLQAYKEELINKKSKLME